MERVLSNVAALTIIVCGLIYVSHNVNYFGIPMSNVVMMHR